MMGECKEFYDNCVYYYFNIFNPHECMHNLEFLYRNPANDSVTLSPYEDPVENPVRIKSF
jgi:hypothetical protein